MTPAPRTVPDGRSPSGVDSLVLRRTCGNFATGVTVITTGTAATGSAGVTVNSFTSVSLDPPLVLFCVHRASRLLPALREAGGFAVNFLSHSQEPVAWTFAGRESARFDEVPHHWSRSGPPVLSEALAHLVCRTHAEYDGGDHAIVLGEVVEIGEEREDGHPLVFYRGSMGLLDHGLRLPRD